MTPNQLPSSDLGYHLRFAPDVANRLGGRHPSVIAPYPVLDVRMYPPRASFLPRPDAGRSVGFPWFAVFLLARFGIAISVLMSVVR